MRVLHRFTKPGHVAEVCERVVTAFAAFEWLIFIDGQLTESHLFHGSRVDQYNSELAARIAQFVDGGWIHVSPSAKEAPKMPQVGAQRPCTFPGCAGTQTFSDVSRPPGWSSGTGADDGSVLFSTEEQPGWQCDVEPEHWDEPPVLTLTPGAWMANAEPREAVIYQVGGLPDGASSSIHKRGPHAWELITVWDKTTRSGGTYASPEATLAALHRLIADGWPYSTVVQDATPLIERTDTKEKE